MDETVFVILLLTALCIPIDTFPNIYFFIKEKMTWDDALIYCRSKYTEMAQVLNTENVTAMMSTSTEGYTDKAWIGLLEEAFNWTWVDGQAITYSIWNTGQPDNAKNNDICVSMTSDGYWNDYSCDKTRYALCSSGGDNPTYMNSSTELSWADAKTYCESQHATLATFPTYNTTNFDIQKPIQPGEEAWIGLSSYNLWYWTETSEYYTFRNWHSDQPDDVNNDLNCAAVTVTDGTWADEQCNATYPFFCYGIYKSWKTVVRIKIKTSSNMAQPEYSTRLLLKLYEQFVMKGTTDFKLTWTKKPVKQNHKVMQETCGLIISN